MRQVPMGQVRSVGSSDDTKVGEVEMSQLRPRDRPPAPPLPKKQKRFRKEPTMMEHAPLSDYELQRLSNIGKCEEYLRSLGLM